LFVYLLYCLFVDIGNSTYGIFQKPLIFIQASEVCEQHGGALASIPDSFVNEQLKNAISNLSKPNNLPNTTVMLGGYYIGLNDRQTEDTWMWLNDDQDLNWENWYNDSVNGQEPNGGTRDNCVALLVNGFWNDVPCHNHSSLQKYPLYFICEKSKYKTFC